MNPLENLIRDHRDIEVALDVMDAITAGAGREPFELTRFEQLAHFAELWADGAHYEKEEHLFAELEQVGVPRQVGPTAFLELEHSATRAQTRRMLDAIRAIGAGQDDQRSTLLDAVARYSAVVRLHIPKEDLGYFQMSAHALSPAAQSRLEQRFEAIDARLPASFTQAAQSLRAPSQAGLAGPSRWLEAPGREVDQLLRTLKVEGEGVGSPLQITRRRVTSPKPGRS